MRKMRPEVWTNQARPRMLKAARLRDGANPNQEAQASRKAMR